MTDYRLPMNSVKLGSDDRSAEQAVPTMGRGRTMETMLSFIKSSPGVFKNNNEVAATKKSDDNACNCDRPMRNIMCKSCGYLSRGRVQTRCPCHHNVIHLMDISVCPNCQANTLKEFGTATPKK